MALKDATADVVVRVRRTVVVDVERTVILVLVIVTAMVQARVTTVIVPVIRDIVCCTVDPICLFMKISSEMQGEGAAAPSPLHSYPYRGYHAAFGGRSWRRQPMTSLALDVL